VGAGRSVEVMGANNSNLKQAVKDEYNRVQSSGAQYLVRAPWGRCRPQRSQQPRQVDIPDTGPRHSSLLLTRPSSGGVCTDGPSVSGAARRRRLLGISVGAGPSGRAGWLGEPERRWEGLARWGGCMLVFACYMASTTAVAAALWTALGRFSPR
jgi:hypothetical protein